MKIDFIPSSSDVELFIPHPKPAAFFIPEWYKNEKKKTMKNTLAKDMVSKNFGVKSCMPFLDSMTNGYIQETWCDIYIEINEELGTASYYYAHYPEIIGVRDSASINCAKDFFMPFEFVWKMPWIPKTPRGYSALLTHPLNHFHLPFFVTSGIIDSDKFHHASFPNYPFYLKKDFDGFIPAGTPMYQIIPIKRESWHSEGRKFNEKDMKRNLYASEKNFFESYKKMFRVPKIFK